MSEKRVSRERERSVETTSALLSGASARMLLPVQCPDCEHTNAADRKFCARCGRGLWEPCLSCSTVNGAWEKFCGVCGGNLVTLVQERVEKFETLMEQAGMLRTLCRHGEAIGQLERVELSDHPRLTLFTTKCHALAQELQSEWERLELRRGEIFQQAQQLVAERRYEEAGAALESVHHRMRTPEIQQLLDQVRGILEELPVLEREIQEAVAERRTQSILPKVERYLELKPDDQPMRELAEKLGTLQQRQLEARRNQLLNAAKQKVAEHEYAVAAGLVAQVNPAVRTPEVEKFFEYCKNRSDEVVWLTEDLRDLALFDEHALPLAERFQKLRPDDEGVAKLTQRIRRLHEQHAAAPPGKLRRSTPARGPSSFGWPIEMLEGFRHIDDEKIRESEAYIQNYTSFYVASGLALQGLGKSATSINLLPVQKKGLLSMASSVLKKRPKTAWGINLGAYGLKAIKLGFEEKEKDKEKDKRKEPEEPKILALACAYIPYSQPLLHYASSPEALIREALETFLADHKLEDDVVGVSFPAPKTLSRFVTLPPSEKKRLPDLIKYEARQQIPFPLETVTWDYQANGAGDDEQLQEHEVCIFALKTDEASQFLFPLQDLKIKVDLLQAENVALHNLLAFEHYAAFQDRHRDAEGSPRDQVLAVLDIGAASSNLVVGNRHSLWVRNIPLGSQYFNKPLVTEFKLTQDQAEQLKRKPTMGTFASKPYQAMKPLLRDLQSELRRSFSYFEHNFRQRRIKELLVVGGGIRLHGLLRLLRAGAAEPQL